MAKRGRKPVAFCKHGHEIAVVGRYANGSCRACVAKNPSVEPYRPGSRGPAPKKRCINGHDLTPENRYYWRGKLKGCLACHRNHAKAYRQSRGAKPTQKKLVPADPVLEFIDRIGGKEFARQAATILKAKASSVERMVWRAREAGYVTIVTADDLCIALGRHPVEVFGPAWFNYGEIEEVARAV